MFELNIARVGTLLSRRAYLNLFVLRLTRPKDYGYPRINSRSHIRDRPIQSTLDDRLYPHFMSNTMSSTIQTTPIQSTTSDRHNRTRLPASRRPDRPRALRQPLTQQHQLALPTLTPNNSTHSSSSIVSPPHYTSHAYSPTMRRLHMTLPFQQTIYSRHATP